MGFYQPLYSQDNIENGHEWVDLGLSVKWATCNVEASVPEQYGNYYAWGETKPKDEYTQSNSVTFEQNISDFSGNPQYDAAAANWGGDWRMPTEAEMNELSSRCTWEWIKQNGVRGYKVTGPNGNIIFLPASGYWYATSFTDGSCGYTYYWSSTSHSSYTSSAYTLRFDSGSRIVDSHNRYYGYSVRPVREWKDGEIPSVEVSVNSTDITAVVNTYVSSPISEITECGFYWGTNPNPTEADNNVVLENTTGSIAKVITNLTPNTTYYVKAYAANSSGTSYSEIISFTTLDKVEYDYVDLGLPSKLKWATYNLGASSPEECGNYYAWGEVTPKTEYTPSNSETYGMLMNDISGNPQYDAAAANWGGGWRMPTNTEMQELIDCCTWEWTIQGGKNGYKVKSKTNDNSIFIPATGYRSGTSRENYGTYGYYWNSIPKDDNVSSYCMYFGSSEHYVSSGNRYYGRTIRPVKDSEDEEAPSVSVTINSTDITAIVDTYVSSSTEITARGFYWGTNPNPTEADNNVVLENTTGSIAKVITNLTPNTTYYVKAYATNSYGTSYSEVVSFTTLAESAFTDYVDLGLPSGLKWATYNVGASTPEEYGNYYAWGEVTPKTEYTPSNSETHGVPLTDISGNPQYDAAAANWGGDWRMPTKTEMHELIDNCTWVWLLQNGTMGYKVTGPNGSSIFLPAAGCRSGSSLLSAGSYGYYWSSTPDGSTYAYDLHFGNGHYVSSDGCNYGFTVRPVRE